MWTDEDAARQVLLLLLNYCCCCCSSLLMLMMMLITLLVRYSALQQHSSDSDQSASPVAVTNCWNESSRTSRLRLSHVALSCRNNARHHDDGSRDARIQFKQRDSLSAVVPGTSRCSLTWCERVRRLRHDGRRAHDTGAPGTPVSDSRQICNSTRSAHRRTSRTDTSVGCIFRTHMIERLLKLQNLSTSLQL